MSADVHGEVGQETHEEHLPHGSVWPILLAMAITVIGLGFLFLDGGAWLLGLGVVALLAVLVGWFREDHEWWRNHITTGKGMARAGILLFISSEVFIFGSLFATYFTFQRLAHHWPDSDIHLNIPLTALFSLFLFASSWTIHVAEKKIKADDHRGYCLWWGVTILLGLVFVGGQVYEYVDLITSGHTFNPVGEDGQTHASQFNTAFYVLTGTHGLHVVGGLFVLTVFWIRSLLGQFNKDRHDGPQAAAMYWHFVDLVWVFVFGIVYIVPWLQGAFSGGH